MTGPQWLLALAGATLVGVILTVAMAWWILWS